MRVPLLLLLGALLLQAAWVLTLPPFRGTDEFDHAYRAAAVAGGQWRAPGTLPQDGRGQLVRVPASLVRAAQPVCSSLPYTGRDNCYAVRPAGRGRVEVASAASTYNPLFYWVVGSVAAPFDGASALYAMRVAAALLCSAFLALAGWATTRWARTPWPLVAMVAAVTPVMLFSTSVAAPNGLEMTAALSVWTALLGLHTRRGREEHLRSLLVVATVGAVVLTTLRSIGPLWLVLIVLTALLPLGPRAVARMARVEVRTVTVGVVAVLVATLAGVGWTLTAGGTGVESFPTDVPNRLTGSLAQLPLWFLQGIAAFPRRGTAAPGLVYVLVGAVLLAVVLLGARHADRRRRLAMLAVLVVAVAVPLALTIPTIRTAGAIWQGRYGLPYHLGLTLLAGLALELSPPRHRWTVVLVPLGAAGLVVANAASVLHVLDTELRTSPLAGTSHWQPVPAPVAAALVLLGFAAWAAATASARDVRDGRDPPGPPGTTGPPHGVQVG